MGEMPAWLQQGQHFYTSANQGLKILLTTHIFLRRNFTDRSNDGKKEEQFFIPKFHADYDEVD